jgi:outer membrane cobalamin receptor
MHRLCSLGALACSLLCASALAQPVREPPVEVFAERLPGVESFGSRAVSVITREQIERRAPQSVTELLREVAGLHVDRLGNAGGSSNVYMRGADPNHTVVMIDGVRVNDPTDARGGGFDFSEVALAEVERIEILRGAGSAQFGADAMGGVINVVTRSGSAREGNTDVRAQVGTQLLRELRGFAAAGAMSAGAAATRDGLERDGGSAQVRPPHETASSATAARPNARMPGARWRSIRPKAPGSDSALAGSMRTRVRFPNRAAASALP